MKCMPVAIFTTILAFLSGCQGVGMAVAEVLEDIARAPGELLAAPFRKGELSPPEPDTHMAGFIVDEQGNELTDTRITLVSNYGVRTPLENDGASRFDIRHPGRMWYVAFARDGYYSRDFSIDGQNLTLYREADFEVERRPQMPLTDARIVLRKHGTLVDLDRRLETLMVDAGGGGIVVSPLRPVSDWEAAIWVPQVESAGPSALYLTTSRTAEGIPGVYLTGTRGTIPKPAEVRIGIAGQGNGLIPYTATSEDDVWFQMREAPADGYQQEVTLSPEQMNRFLENERLYFYIRCGNQYGRLSLSDWSLSERNRMMVSRYGVRVFLEMQRDGSRNLEQNPGLLDPY